MKVILIGAGNLDLAHLSTLLKSLRGADVLLVDVENQEATCEWFDEKIKPLKIDLDKLIAEGYSVFGVNPDTVIISDKCEGLPNIILPESLPYSRLLVDPIPVLKNVPKKVLKYEAKQKVKQGWRNPYRK